MTTRTQIGTSKTKSRKTATPRFATKADIAHITRSLDRIRDDQTRYMICMTLDLITQHIAERDGGDDPSNVHSSLN